MSTLNAFDYESDGEGVRVFASRRPLFAGCRTDDELRSHITRLKRELDELAMAIKIAKQNQYPLINSNKRRFR